MSGLADLSIQELYHQRVVALATIEMYRAQLRALKSELSRRTNLSSAESLDSGGERE